MQITKRYFVVIMIMLNLNFFMAGTVFGIYWFARKIDDITVGMLDSCLDYHHRD